MNKKSELLAKYLSDLSKILFGAVVVKQFVEKEIDIVNFIFGLLWTIGFFILAYIIQPEERT